jgi:hypothetical protein
MRVNRLWIVLACLVFAAALFQGVIAQSTGLLDVDTGMPATVAARMALVSGELPQPGAYQRAMTAAERRAAVDAVWGPGFGPEVSLQIFDRFWNHVDVKFAAFQGLNVDWRAMRDRYRPEVADGVSRGRLAAIINHMSLALRDGHTVPLDLVVNAYTLPDRGIPLMAVGTWMLDTSGACSTAQADGSALVYDVAPGHPLGLERGDRILGYDGIPWRTLYQQLIAEELPTWPLWWGSGPEGFDHAFVMSASSNWHLFDTMDILKASGVVQHLPTSLMPGAMVSDFCSEQLPVLGVPKPTWIDDKTVSYGIVDGTNVGYIYVWGWFGTASVDFRDAIRDLGNVRGVDALVIDFRFNVGGFLRGPLGGIAALFERPTATIGMDQRMRARDHVAMKMFAMPSEFKADFTGLFLRDKGSFDGPIAVLTGPGALSAGDYSTIWASFHPNARLFGKTTAMAAGLPTQPALGTELILHPEWWATIAETNTYFVGAPKQYLIHTDLPVHERVWLTPQDVANGRDTVVNAALAWIASQTP